MKTIKFPVFGSEIENPPRGAEKHKNNVISALAGRLNCLSSYKQLDSIQKVLCGDNNPVTEQLHTRSLCLKQLFVPMIWKRNISTIILYYIYSPSSSSVQMSWPEDNMLKDTVNYSRTSYTRAGDGAAFFHSCENSFRFFKCFSNNIFSEKTSLFQVTCFFFV